MKLTRNGKPFEIHPPRPQLVKLRKLLDQLPLGELKTVYDLAKMIGGSYESVSGASIRKPLAEYSFKTRGRSYFGNRATIAQLKKEQANADRN